MISVGDKRLLKRYRHLVAALRTIQDYKKNQLNFCDRQVIKGAFKYRHCSDFKFALALVDQNIAGRESLGASWF